MDSEEGDGQGDEGEGDEGEGDGEAVKIYANAFNKDKEFSLDLLGNFVTIDFRYFFAE